MKEKDHTAKGVFDFLSAPAQRAFEQAKIYHLQDLMQWSSKELLQLHGIGKSTLVRLRERGIRWKGE